MTVYKFGKTPARKGAVSFQFRDFFDAKKLPKPPAVFGHYQSVTDFHMLANDQYGNCLAEGTLVSSPDINRAFKAPYIGTMLTICLASGKQITVTAKHSLLTSEGFAAADTIKEGDYLVGTSGTQILPRLAGGSAETHRDHGPTPVEEVLRALSLRSGSARVVVPRAIDFHGDEKFFYGNVEVVNADSLLGGKHNAPLGQPYAQDEIGAAGQLHRFLVRSSALLHTALRGLFAAHGDIRLCCDGSALAYTQPSISQTQRLSLGAEQVPGFHNDLLKIFSGDSAGLTSGILKGRAVNVQSDGLTDISVFSGGDKSSYLGGRPSRPKASLNHPSPDRPRTEPHFLSDLRDAFPGLVELDRVVNIYVQRNVRTHVYDLSTDSRWYLANGIVSHNCVWAGAAHEHMIWSTEGGRQRNRFTVTDVLSDYAAVTGFDKSQTDAQGNNPTDQGTDMSLAASYRRKTGIIDATNTRRKIDGYLALEAGNWDQLIIAAYLFGATGIGVQLPQSALDQFDKHQPWTVPWTRTKIVGGHYICGVGRDANGNVPIVSWGAVNPMTQKWYERFNDETLCYFSLDVLNAKNLSPEGFDADALRRHMANLKGSQ